MAVLTPLSEADAWETAEEDVVPGGAPTLAAVPGGHPPLATLTDSAPPLAAVPGGHPPLAILTDGAPPLDSRAPDVAGGGAPPLSALLATTRAPTPLPPALYEAAHRFFRGRERWAEVNSMSPCIGSRYWEHHLPEDQSIEGIAPIEFFGPHPVWEGFAVPVRRNAKVKHFYCTFCKKVLPGEANRAYDHIVKGQAKKCRISMACKEFLVKKKKAFSERRSILHSKKNQVNDGVTTWEQMNADTLMAKLMVELSQHNDCETWYGTTRVVVMAEALLEQAEQLLERGVHPVRIAEGYEMAAKIAFDHLQYLSQRFSADNIEPLVQILMTTLSPKIANHCKRPLAEIAAKAVLAVADIERRDVNLDLIKVEGKAGGKPEDTELVYGIVVGKYMSLPEVPIRIEDVKVAILTCSYEPQNPQAKHRHQQEQKYFDEMVQKCKDVGATLAICQWGFDEEPNHLMMHTSLPAVRWVKFDDLESIAMATGGHTVPRFQELSPGKLGKAGLVREKTFGTGKDLILFIEQCVNSRAVTIFVRGENTMIVEEMKQSVKDALSMASNLFGGGSVDTSCAVSVETAADHYPGFEQDAIRSFAYALDSIPGAKNNSLPHPVATLTEVKAQEVFGTMICKRQQNILHATRVVKIILKMGLNCD